MSHELSFNELCEAGKDSIRIFDQSKRRGLNRAGEMVYFNQLDRCFGRCSYYSGKCEICRGTAYTDSDKKFDKKHDIIGENFRLHNDWKDPEDPDFCKESEDPDFWKDLWKDLL